MPLTGEFDDDRSREWFQRVQHDPGRIDVMLDAQRVAVAAGGLTGVDRATGRAELYAIVSPDARGEGHGRHLVAGLCHVGFDQLGLHRIFLWTYSTNTAARHLYQSCGFQEEGVLREHAVVAGARVDRVAMGILRREWVQQPTQNDTPSLDHSLAQESHT